MLARAFLFLLKHSKLSREGQLILLNEALSTVGVLPIHATLSVDGEGRLLLRGRPVDPEKLIQLRESAANVVSSQAFKFVRDQALYLAVSHGLHEALGWDNTMYAKAAIWYSQQEYELLKALAGDSQELTL